MLNRTQNTYKLLSREKVMLFKEKIYNYISILTILECSIQLHLNTFEL